MRSIEAERLNISTLPGNHGPKFLPLEIETFISVENNEYANSTEKVYIHNVNTFPYHLIRGKFKKKKSIEYYENAQAFDIETTNVMCENPYSFMYLWQACIDEKVIMGRTWDEFTEFISKLKSQLNLSLRRRLVFYVHNLSFEFQFLKTILNIYSVFARGKRKILKAVTSDGIEFRCSYFLSNMNLERFLQKENVKYRKVTTSLSEDILQFDYKKYRDEDTILTNLELSYGCNDVLGLYHAVNHIMKENNDNIITIPLTSTGYVRREVRNRTQSTKHRNLCKKLSLSLEEYKLAKDAFRGGNTHCNYNYSGHIIENVDSYDISSSYPFVMMVEKFPMTKFEKASPSQFNSLLRDGKALLFRIRLENVKLRNVYDIPYIPVSKCKKHINVLNDNGRVLTADVIEMAITDIDYEIIRKQYEFSKVYISDLHYAEYGYLPVGIRESILEYFEKKTLLKGVEGEEYYYAKSKNSLNSIFGMMVTDIIMEVFNFNTETHEIEKEEDDNEKQREKLTQYYDSKNLFLAYQWGVWVTAHARKNLEKLFDAMGETKIYGDTDSSKAFSIDKTKIDKLNDDVIAKCLKAPIIPRAKDKNGNWVYMGVYEHDAHYERFISWGAKKYAYEQIKKGKIYTNVTVAGLSKEKGAKQLEEDGLEKFKPGWTVSPSGNLVAYYHDTLRTVEINGIVKTIPSYVALFDSSYELSIDKEYDEILKKTVDKCACF